MIIEAFLAAFTMGRRRGYAFLMQKADAWRESCRQRWWRYKVKTLLSCTDTDDDLLADAIGQFFKFETPPEDSFWTLERGIYIPGLGSGYIRNNRGEYLPSR
jgi:hypothetical protein